MNTNKKHFKLPKEFAEQWLKDLRSREFSQITGHLYLEDGYCCLGVACTQFISSEDLEDLAEESELSEPIEVLDANIGFPSDLLSINKPENKTKLGSLLANMNDGLKYETYIADYKNLPLVWSKKPVYHNDRIYYSFEEIADFIENNVEFIEE